MTVFISSRLKLKRARQLICDLKNLLARHLEENPPRTELIGMQPSEDGKGPWATSKITLPPPPEMTPVLIGDIIHNIRSSLDHVASEMARINSKPDKHVYFPFGESASGLEEQIKRKNFTYCGDDAVALLRTFKPYKQGNLELRALHDLDILDKHRALVPEAHVKIGSMQPFEWTGPPVNGERPMRWIPPRLSNLEYIFSPDTPLPDRPIVVALEGLLGLCEGMLETFAALYPSQQIEKRGQSSSSAQAAMRLKSDV